MDFRELLSRHAAVAIEKQLRLARSVAGAVWSWNLQEGSLRIDGQERPFQILGIEQAPSGCWRWAWADADEGLPPRFLGAARALRAWGLRRKIRELSEPEIPLDRVCGTEVAAVACSLLDTPGWWRAPFDGGVAWLLLTDPTLDQRPSPQPADVARILTRTLAIFPVDHELALNAYVLHHGGSVERAGRVATARIRGGQVVARFDERRRIERLEAKVA